MVSKNANGDRRTKTRGIGPNSAPIRSNDEWAPPLVGGSIFAIHPAQRLPLPCTRPPKFWPVTSLHSRKDARNGLRGRSRLIAGSAWARLNAVAYLLVPAAYSIDPAVTALLPDWHGRVALFTYYAFAQVLTIGYADVTPIRAPATTLSLFAALFGVFYTAIVVSVFVGLAQSGKHHSPSDE